MKIGIVGAELFHAHGRTDGRTEGQTDRYDETKATNTHSYYVILIAFPMVTMVARPHLNVIRSLPVLFRIKTDFDYVSCDNI
jgi:hypothetical protein